MDANLHNVQRDPLGDFMCVMVWIRELLRKQQRNGVEELKMWRLAGKSGFLAVVRSGNIYWGFAVKPSLKAAEIGIKNDVTTPKLPWRMTMRFVARLMGGMFTSRIVFEGRLTTAYLIVLETHMGIRAWLFDAYGMQEVADIQVGTVVQPGLEECNEYA